MSRLPSCTSRDVHKALKKAGFERLTQRGSHLHLRHPQTRRRTIVPIHPGDLRRSTLKEIIKQAGLTEEEFR